MQAFIEKIQRHAERISAGDIEQVRPGMEASFTDACQPNDAIRQGDLYLIIVDAVPDGYERVVKPTKTDRKLVPGNTEGSRHTLDSLAGVTLYHPKVWSEESLEGPCFVLTRRRKILHPTHGHIIIPAGFTILCRYQREFDKELQRERRTRD